MSENTAAKILIAEDNDISRDMMAKILQTHGYEIIPAADGKEAMRAIDGHNIALALVDINMAPISGFEFLRYAKSNNFKNPVVIVTGDSSSHILMEANELGVAHIMQKPIVPDVLINTVERMLKRFNIKHTHIASESYKTKFSHEQLLQRALDIAVQNVAQGKGGPYGAIVADAQGKILGEGANGRQARIDPVAHAEVMAIRQAADKLGKTSLSDCIVYCASEPTKIGKALIESVGIETVYYGLSHADMKAFSEPRPYNETTYKQMSKDEALAIYTQLHAAKD